MAGRTARHMGAKADGGRPGHQRRHLVAAALAAVLAVVALGAVLLAAQGGPGAAPKANAPSAPADTGQAAAGQEGPAAAGGGAAANELAPATNGGDAGASAEGAAEGAPAAGGQGETQQAGGQTSPRVRDAVEPLVDGAPGTVSVAYVPLSDAGDACYLGADRKMRSASLIKLVVLAEYLREVDAGKLSAGETYTLRASDIVGGTGSLQGRGAGYATTLDELARLMVCESDNVAANVLIGRMGMDAVNAEASALGLSSTVLERKMMDSSALAAGRDNYTSARDVARVLYLIGTGGLVSREASSKALGWLEQQTDRAGIPAGLPAGTTVGNKTGSLESARHDGAVVLGGNPYVLVVMTDGMGADSANALIARMSQAVWEAVS